MRACFCKAHAALIFRHTASYAINQAAYQEGAAKGAHWGCNTKHSSRCCRGAPALACTTCSQLCLCAAWTANPLRIASMQHEDSTHCSNKRFSIPTQRLHRLFDNPIFTKIGKQIQEKLSANRPMRCRCPNLEAQLMQCLHATAKRHSMGCSSEPYLCYGEPPHSQAHEVGEEDGTKAPEDADVGASIQRAQYDPECCSTQRVHGCQD